MKASLRLSNGRKIFCLPTFLCIKPLKLIHYIPLRNIKPKYFILLRMISRGISPNTPKEQSISCHVKGIDLMLPKMSAVGIIITQQIIPKCITQMFFTGSISGPRKSIAIMICA